MVYVCVCVSMYVCMYMYIYCVCVYGICMCMTAFENSLINSPVLNYLKLGYENLHYFRPRMQINTHPREVSFLFCPRVGSSLYRFVRRTQVGRN